MSDWRLQGQEKYLKKKDLYWAKYEPYSNNWDHDHCEFCGLKFAINGAGFQEGYRTLNSYHWICPEFFEDFKDVFGWKIVSDKT